jgi:hypothetical protein
MKLDNTKRYYYHITDRYWPKRITLEPRDNGDNRTFCESDMPRICVAPSISHCLVALPPYTLKVYRTKNKVKAYCPYGIPDSEITKEKWITKTTAFIKVGEIKKELLEKYREESDLDNIMYGEPDKTTMDFQRKWLKHFQKIEKDLI